MEVYIEYVILDNFIIDFILIYASLFTLRLKKNKLLIALSAGIGAAFAVCLPFIALSGVLMFLIKLLAGMIMVLLSCRFKSIKKFVFTYLLFITYTFALGGALTGVMYMLGNDFSFSGVFIYQTDIPLWLIIGGACLAAAIIRIIFSKLYKKRDIFPFIRRVIVKKGETETEGQAFIDSGNRLFDRVTGFPVVVVSKDFAAKLLDFDNGTEVRHMRLATVTGVSKMMIFPIDNLKIYNGEDAHIIENVMIGVSPSPFRDGEGYDMLLNPSLIID